VFLNIRVIDLIEKAGRRFGPLGPFPRKVFLRRAILGNKAIIRFEDANSFRYVCTDPGIVIRSFGLWIKALWQAG
jgi:hypothetical protein